VHAHAQLGGPSRIFVTETACWGYCRKNGEVIINWQLAYLPIRLAEFVILHELVHLQVLNHQREFHSKMLKLMPDYLMRESELRYYQTIEPEALNNIRRNRTARMLGSKSIWVLSFNGCVV